MEMNNEIRDEYYSRHVIYNMLVICVFMTINFEISNLMFTLIRKIKTIFTFKYFLYGRIQRKKKKVSKYIQYLII